MRRMKKHTYKLARSQFALGSVSMPSKRFTAFMVVSSVMKPGLSIVAHPSFPGRLSREEVLCLPILTRFPNQRTTLPRGK